MIDDTPTKLTPRQIAKAAGLTRYFTRVPCIHGHVDDRYVRDNKCVACMREKHKRLRKRK